MSDSCQIITYITAEPWHITRPTPALNHKGVFLPQTARSHHGVLALRVKKEAIAVPPRCASKRELPASPYIPVVTAIAANRMTVSYSLCRMLAAVRLPQWCGAWFSLTPYFLWRIRQRRAWSSQSWRWPFIVCGSSLAEFCFSSEWVILIGRPLLSEQGSIWQG